MINLKCFLHQNTTALYCCLEEKCKWKVFCHSCRMDHAKFHNNDFTDIAISEISSRNNIRNLKNNLSIAVQKNIIDLGLLLSESKRFFDEFHKELVNCFDKFYQEDSHSKEIEDELRTTSEVFDSMKFSNSNDPVKLRIYARQFLKCKDFIQNFEAHDEKLVLRKFQNRFTFVRNRLTDMIIKLREEVFEDKNLADQLNYEEDLNLDFSVLRANYENCIRESITSLGVPTSLNLSTPLEIPNITESQAMIFDQYRARISNNLYDDYYVNKELIDEEIEELKIEPAIRDNIFDMVLNDSEKLVKPLTTIQNAFEGSLTILTMKEKEFVLKKLFPKNPKFVLVFRASAFNFSPAKFHEYCDRRGPTLVVARTDDHLFGGFIDKSWESPKKWKFKSSNEAFLFSVSKNLVYHLKSSLNSKAILCREDSGPCFGMKELALSYEGKINTNYSHIGLEFGKNSDFYTFTSLTKKTLFSIKEYEVFLVLNENSD